MRQMLLALAVAALGGFMTASCGNSSNNNGDMGKDMAGSGSGQDMVVVKANCMGVALCMYECLGMPNADINSCFSSCSKNAKAGSATKWFNAVICGQSYCVGDEDMMTGKCVSVPVDPTKTGPNDPHQLCDPGITLATCQDPNYMSTSCSPCIEQARNFWFEDSTVDPMNPGPPTGMCSMPTSADCMGAKTTCMTQFSACLNDM